MKLCKGWNENRKTEPQFTDRFWNEKWKTGGAILNFSSQWERENPQERNKAGTMVLEHFLNELVTKLKVSRS